MDIDMKARLLKGCNIKYDGITIKNYTLGEIFDDIGLTRYLQMSNFATRKPRDFFSEEYSYMAKKLSLFDVFCIEDIVPIVKDFLNFFTGYEWEFICTDVFVEFGAINECGEKVHINKENLNNVLEIIKIMYCLDKSKRESDRDDIDDEMRELLREFEEEEEKIKRAKCGNITIVSIIDGISVKHKSLNLLNIWGYTMYQTIHTYHGLNIVDNEDRVVSAVYGGTIDGKKTDLEKIHWANPID